MKAAFELVRKDERTSLFARDLIEPVFSAVWHFHPELELTLILNGSGIRFVGDTAEPFSKHDLVLLGPNLPHFWSITGRVPPAPAHAVFTQFRSELITASTLAVPEFQAIRNFVESARLGIVFPEQVAKEIEPQYRQIPFLKGVRRLTSLLETLDKLSHDAAEGRGRQLCSPHYQPEIDDIAQRRIKRACDFISQNFRNRIRLEDVACAAHLSPAAFCRFFRRVMGMPVTDFVHQVRISHAARLLAESEDKIVNIAFASGYRNLSNFNRWFLAIRQETPRQFRKKWHHAFAKHPPTQIWRPES